MIIRWKKNNPNTIPFKGVGKKVNKVRLIEGLNTVDDDDWKLAKKNLTKYDERYYDEIEDAKKIEVPTNVDGKEKMVKKDVVGLRSFESNDCIDMIDDCFSVPTLEAWLADEPRDEIRAALKEKLDAILKDNMTKEKQDNKSKKKKKGRK